jgi:hypothetical protein
MAIHRSTGAEGLTVTFVLPGDAPEVPVSVVGSFNDWTPGAHPLTADPDGGHSVTVVVPSGSAVHFRYLGADGLWFDDPEADEVTAEGSVLWASAVEVEEVAEPEAEVEPEVEAVTEPEVAEPEAAEPEAAEPEAAEPEAAEPEAVVEPEAAAESEAPAEPEAAAVETPAESPAEAPADEPDETGDRLDTVTDKINEAKDAARDLVDRNVLDEVDVNENARHREDSPTDGEVAE